MHNVAEHKTVLSANECSMVRVVSKENKSVVPNVTTEKSRVVLDRVN